DGGARLEIAVLDTGRGVAPDRCEAIFEPFAQVDAATERTHGGTGLGLSISRELARGLGGDLTAEPRPGGGSAFRLSVALDAPVQHAPDAPTRSPQPASPQPQPATSQSPRTGDGRRLLAADDDEIGRKFLALALGKAGFAVETVADGAEALAKATAPGADYAAILLDMQMPVMDGLAAAAAMRDAGLTTPILAITGGAKDADRDACLTAGCTAHFPKPFRPADLRDAVCDLLSE
ncbi:response regulator, partial [Alienimonas sp. DA493]|uniref:ATP-binding response regulator n=1 Tax=Alienimonas sp. DA493 TaxID=3373605 RepID=UPI0037548B09